MKDNKEQEPFWKEALWWFIIAILFSFVVVFSILTSQGK